MTKSFPVPWYFEKCMIINNKWRVANGFLNSRSFCLAFKKTPSAILLQTEMASQVIGLICVKFFKEHHSIHDSLLTTHETESLMIFSTFFIRLSMAAAESFET